MDRQPSVLTRIPFFYFGLLLVLLGLGLYWTAIILSGVRLLTGSSMALRWSETVLQSSEWPTAFGMILAAVDLALMLPEKRRIERRIEAPPATNYEATVALTAYNDEESIEQAVLDFRRHPRVRPAAMKPPSGRQPPEQLCFARRSRVTAAACSVA